MTEPARRRALELYCSAHRCAICPLGDVPGLDPEGPCVLTLALCGLNYEADYEG